MIILPFYISGNRSQDFVSGNEAYQRIESVIEEKLIDFDPLILEKDNQDKCLWFPILLKSINKILFPSKDSSRSIKYKKIENATIILRNASSDENSSFKLCFYIPSKIELVYIIAIIILSD